MREPAQGFGSVDTQVGAIGWPGAVRQIAGGGVPRTAWSKACSSAG